GRFESARDMVEAFVALSQSERPSELEPSRPPADRAAEAAAPGDTAPHPPVAKKLDAVRAARPRRWTRRALFGVGAGAVGLGVGWAGSVRPARSADCPAGMALVESATFRVGSAEDAETPTDETPPHSATVRSFCIDVTEVTVKAYSACTSCERAP